jgi:hypothetical protein
LSCLGSGFVEEWMGLGLPFRRLVGKFGVH